LTEKYVKQDQCATPWKSLCCRDVIELIGYSFQVYVFIHVYSETHFYFTLSHSFALFFYCYDALSNIFWEILDRFYEILDLKESLLLEEREKELINPWFNELDFPEKPERGMGGS